MCSPSSYPSFLSQFTPPPPPSFFSTHTAKTPHPSKRSRPSHVTLPPCAVFDFVRKAADEQKKALEALKEGKALEYVKDKVKRDIDEVRRFNQGLSKSREKFARDLASVVQGGPIQVLDDTLDELEEVLIMSDLGVDTVDKILDDLRADARAKRLEQRADIKQRLKDSLVRILDSGANGSVAIKQAHTSPSIIMIIGANGMGKTTTIGKLATRLRREGNTVLVAACDTFRAAAVDQLEEWVRRADADILVPESGQKNASGVLFRAVEKAIAEQYDYLIIDTSGRLHTNVNLMGELQKMVRVVKKFRPEGPDETLLVVDASIGRNAVTQARTWQRDVGVSGLVVTKLDGTARAGFVVSCVDELGLPVKLIGVGEGVDDLRDFDAELFVDGLVG